MSQNHTQYILISKKFVKFIFEKKTDGSIPSVEIS